MGSELREEIEMAKEIEMARVARLDRGVARRSNGEIEMEREREREREWVRGIVRERGKFRWRLKMGEKRS